MIIDAHQHFWEPARGDYDWLTPDMELCRTFAPRDLEPLLREHGVKATILVQAAPTAAETDYLLCIADETPWVAGVVGWIDLAAPDVATAVAHRAQFPYFLGVRPMLQDLPDRAWILREQVGRGLEEVAAAGLVFDALIRGDQLPLVDEMAKRNPQLKIVIDHAAKPPFGRVEPMREWAENLARIAELDNVHCKLSGLVTELPENADQSEVSGCIQRLLGWFGADRLIWGSDWPVLTLRGRYGEWLDLCRTELERHGSRVADAVLGQTAIRVYRPLLAR